jgi:hypothetical protein
MRSPSSLVARLLVMAAALGALLMIAAPAQPVSAGPICTSIADLPFVSGSVVAARHTISCNAPVATITVIGRLRLNNVLQSSQTVTCANTSFCYVYTRAPIQRGSWQAYTSGATTGPNITLPVAASGYLNVP